MKINPSEADIQASFIVWFNLFKPTLADSIFHVPNGGSRFKVKNKRGEWYCPEGNKLKKMGAKSGVADIFLMVPNRQFHGLWLEFKSEKGKQSPEQKEFEKTALSRGYQYKIAKSLDDAIKIVTEYV
jgi:hypothetical protein